MERCGKLDVPAAFVPMKHPQVFTRILLQSSMFRAVFLFWGHRKQISH